MSYTQRRIVAATLASAALLGVSQKGAEFEAAVDGVGNDIKTTAQDIKPDHMFALGNRNALLVKDVKESMINAQQVALAGGEDAKTPSYADVAFDEKGRLTVLVVTPEAVKMPKEATITVGKNKVVMSFVEVSSFEGPDGISAAYRTAKPVAPKSGVAEVSVAMQNGPVTASLEAPGRSTSLVLE